MLLPFLPIHDLSFYYAESILILHNSSDDNLMKQNLAELRNLIPLLTFLLICNTEIVIIICHFMIYLITKIYLKLQFNVKPVNPWLNW